MRELLDLVFRWLHVIAAIMWIGNSLLFNWLDRNLRPAAAPRERSLGEIWLLHSGAFYQVEKTLAIGSVPTRSVHWFKWQAYTTWLSGAALLVIVYYSSAAALLVGAGSPLSPAAAIALGAFAIVGGVVLYEIIWRSPLAAMPRITAGLCFILLIAVGHALGQVFTGRAAFLHVGALMGTIMAANVKLHIIPSQKQFVAAIESGEPGDERLSHRAKLHSIHNNYLTFPVVILMMSSHFPALHTGVAPWAVLAVLVLAGAGVRHLLNIRFSYARWQPALATHMAVAVALLYLLTVRIPATGAPAGSAAVGDDPVSFTDVHAVIQKRCTVCHSVSPADRTFGAPPVGVAFDTPEQIRAWAARIEARAVTLRTMPPANQTWMTDDERALISRWVRQGAQ